MWTSDALFDSERYPVNRRGSGAYDALVNTARQDLDTWNCARLADFVRPEVLADMQAEAKALAPRATYTQGDFNPYFSEAPQDMPEDHPLRRLYSRRHGMVRGDLFARDGAIWAVFQNADICAFVADCLGYERLYLYGDPYGCVNVNVQPSGREFPWHFDHNDFTVSIGLTQPDAGGVFEYVPDIRSAADENYTGVKNVLDGDRSALRTLTLEPGDLQLFRGGYTLHRVTAPRGAERHSLLLSYVRDPTHIATAEYAKRLWGEVHPLHRGEDIRS